jgi:hypothetical protein
MRLHLWKGKAVVLAVLFSAAFLALWFVPSASPPVHVAFLYGTNEPKSGKVGVFELVNNLNEPVTTGGGWYIPATRKDLNTQKGDWGAAIHGGLHTFTARTTNIVQVWIPTNGGPYRLVLQCLPTSKSTPQFYRSARFRVANFVSPWLHPSFVTQARWYGSVFAVSPPFDATP